VTDRMIWGRLTAAVSDVVDAGVDLLPHFELAAIPVLDGTERPLEYPIVKRRLRAEGIRVTGHRGVILLPPGELDRMSSVGLLGGHDELYLCREWNDEFESFPGRITSDLVDFEETTPLGLEEWLVDAGCLLAVGDGAGLNFATLESSLADRLRRRFVGPRKRQT
jgi:hypothetical protein